MKLPFRFWIIGLLFLCLGMPGRGQNITRAEYFFNTDPGVGNGTSLPVTAAGQVDVTGEVDPNGLSSGFHAMYVRVRDQRGRWSLSEGRPFLIAQQPAVPTAAAITRAEYFIDTDPGIGNGTSLSVATSSGQVNMFAEIATTGLSTKFHTLYIRLRDAAGKWSLSEGRPFFIDPVTGSMATIVAAEYFFDNANPANGQATRLAVVPSPQVDLERQIDVTGLVAGRHRLHLRLRDNKGAWSYTEIKEFTVATPRIDAITPASGGNLGDVTVTISGASFDPDTKLKLTRSGQPDIVVPDSLQTILNGEQLQASLDLRGKAVGDYDVVVTLGNGTALTIPNGFLVLTGIKAAPWAEIIGFDRIRRGQWQTYTVAYGNRGNVDATGVPLWIQIPENSEYKLNFKLYKPKSATIDYDSIAGSFIADTIHGNAEKGRIIPLIIASMRPNEVGTLTFQLKTNATSNIVLSAWASTPMYQSPISNDVIDCLSNLTAIIVSPIVGAGCVHALLDLGVKPFVKQILNDDNGLYDKEGKFQAADFMANAVFTLVGCIPFAKLGPVAAKLFEGVATVGESKNGFDGGTNCAKAFVPPAGPKKNKTVQPVASFDPNDKVGLDGAGSRKYIRGTEIFPYLIRFENIASATAAAQTVRIVDTLDIKTLDISTLQLGSFSFDEIRVTIPPGRKNHTVDVDLRPGNNIIVRIEAKLDEVKGILTCTYSSLDPLTLQPTQNPDAGFLPPNKRAPEGEGGVFYTIRPKPNLATNVSIRNMAYIYFDNNAVIATPAWMNTIDKLPPVSRVAALAPVQFKTDFTVSWSGTDEGSGISRYNIFVAVNNRPYKQWLRGVTVKSETFTGHVDSTYHFYSVAVDSTGQIEPTPTVAHASTKISILTSAKAELEKQIAIYPNPAYQTLTVQLPNELVRSELTLVTMHGKVAVIRIAMEAATRLPVHDLAPGMYVLRIANDRTVITRKVMVK